MGLGLTGRLVVAGGVADCAMGGWDSGLVGGEYARGCVDGTELDEGVPVSLGGGA